MTKRFSSMASTGAMAVMRSFSSRPMKLTIARPFAFRAACVTFAQQLYERGAALLVMGDDKSAQFPIVIDDYWPDFKPHHLDDALTWFAQQDLTLCG